MTIYTVQSGDSVSSIARNFGVPASQIVLNNALENPNRLSIGQNLFIYSDTNKLRAIDVNGYAFPGTPQSVLSLTFPYLTYISIFSYEVRPNGTLSDISENRIIQDAYASNVAPLMVITNIEEGGTFSSELASVILNDSGTQQVLLNNILQTMREKGYYGLNIDFEYVFPSDRESYNTFVQRASDLLHENGFFISTALAPKLSGDQQGLLYEAHDYAFHGRYVDRVILMTYEWGYTYGPAQAVAPINQVEKVLQYATSVMPSEKILMGMPNYGYDWTLPFVPGSAAQALSNQQAINLAWNVNAQIQYDETAQSPFFTYFDSNGAEHIVYFDDVRSIAARLELVNRYNLAGVSYWNINTFFKPNWVVLNAMYDVNKVV